MADLIPPKLNRMRLRSGYDRSADREAGCIYQISGEPLHKGPFSDEHIIAESIGGGLVLESASCAACASETHAFEGRAVELYKVLRHKLGFPMSAETKRRVKLYGQEKFPILVNGKKIKIPVSEHPALVTQLSFAMPGILVDQPMDDRPLAGTIHNFATGPDFPISFSHLVSKYGTREIGFPPTVRPGHEGYRDFGRMLAKAAHAFTVAELGLGKFRPLLLGAVLNREPLNLAHYIGSSVMTAQATSAGTDLHEIGFAPSDTFGASDFIIVKVRLFASYDGPTHYVVAGERI